MTVALAEQPQGWPFSMCAVFLPPSALPPPSVGTHWVANLNSM
ncbi:hypothetical protein FY044_18185 [Leclercia adecarboxylata]|nr:hypothetical protein [Leclercia adecarboxylata]QIG31151.1 hypothetical protein FY044_18185 [Leclercia adecarboxylata]